MESFFKLRAEKQKNIIDAALNIFAKNGYKKSSIGDIADEASISKGMISYYFGSKKNLFMYLMELCGGLLVDEMEARFDAGETDFFDRIKLANDIKISVMKKYRSGIMFFTVACTETDPEVKTDIANFLNGDIGLRMSRLTASTDISGFKNDVDPSLLELFIIRASDDLLRGLRTEKDKEKLNIIVDEFNSCLDMLKKHMYIQESNEL